MTSEIDNIDIDRDPGSQFTSAMYYDDHNINHVFTYIVCLK